LPFRPAFLNLLGETVEEVAAPVRPIHSRLIPCPEFEMPTEPALRWWSCW
jgi:hypothetical protein